MVYVNNNTSLQTAILNKHLQSLMDGLTAKVFRTYNASKTLQEQLALLTDRKYYFHIYLFIVTGSMYVCCSIIR